jgi:hypothetical protein
MVPQTAPDLTTEKVETICLVSCVGVKRAVPAPAKYLYQSDWFAKARAYVEGIGSRWFILSAKHGLVHHDDVISRYKQTLNTMGICERRAHPKAMKRLQHSMLVGTVNG